MELIPAKVKILISHYIPNTICLYIVQRWTQSWTRAALQHAYTHTIETQCVSRSLLDDKTPHFDFRLETIIEKWEKLLVGRKEIKWHSQSMKNMNWIQNQSRLQCECLHMCFLWKHYEYLDTSTNNLNDWANDCEYWNAPRLNVNHRPSTEIIATRWRIVSKYIGLQTRQVHGNNKTFLGTKLLPLCYWYIAYRSISIQYTYMYVEYVYSIEQTDSCVVARYAC